MRPILKTIVFVSLVSLAACDTGPKQQATYVPPESADATPASIAAAGGMPSSSTNAMPPGGVVMPTAAPPIPAYGNQAVPRTPYFYPPVTMGVHVPH